MAKKKAAGTRVASTKREKGTQIGSVRHKDKRKNIPTEELRDFVRAEDQEAAPVLYPRDPSLDPQLVWRGKDAQDAEPLSVPTVPIYIQEKIHPQHIIEDFRVSLPKLEEDADPQLELFADFNGLPEEFDQRVDFYQHDGNWSNRMILGDSLLVMNSLAEKEGLRGQVQMIYIDPPYGIKFASNWQVSTRKRQVQDGKAEDATRQPEQIRAFRDTWKDGIHSYLSYLRDQLVLARDLLSESGSVFVQISETNVHRVRCLLDEVFGDLNFITEIQFVTTGSQTSDRLPVVTDYLLWYAKDSQQTKFRPLLLEQGRRALAPTISWYVEHPNDQVHSLTRDQIANPDSLPADSTILWLADLLSRSGGQSTKYEAVFRGKGQRPHRGGWRTHEVGMTRLVKSNRLFRKGKTLLFRRYLDDYPYTVLNSLWLDTQMGGFASKDKVYVVQTHTKVIERCMLMTTDPGDLVIDPTCGSGTTAYVAEEWGRRWITIDTSRVSITLARTRLMAGRFPYYLMADSPEGIEREAETLGKLPPRPVPTTEGDIRKGFVYRRVPHVTLKAIANNEEIDAIHARWQEQLEPLRAKINEEFGKGWEEWDVPRPDALDPAPAARKRKLLDQWWDARRRRQEEIDASIARRSDTEILYDRPYEDKRRVRVSGPFTVESLSPHRTISVAEKAGRSEHWKDGRNLKVLGPDKFGQMIIDNLRKAGVQNTKKNERLKFDALEPYAGEWLHAEGRYTEKDGTAKRAVVCIGPEYGTVGPELVKEAAKEAVQGVGFDLLIVCGFAFDPHVSQEATRYGRLAVLPCRMNPDLAMGDELLKKTGAGNLFMVFGEPDLTVTESDDGQLVVELRGVDVYDPTTGEIRSSSTDDVACWFIDTSYNEESFFVRHAYFTGADEPYEKLKRALRAEIDEAAWSDLYSTRSRPFPKPETGRIAVKVINHYGDEVLNVYGV